jgi:hypothetical protein
MKRRSSAAIVPSGVLAEWGQGKRTSNRFTIVLTCEFVTDEPSSTSDFGTFRVLGSSVLPGRGE